jgi:putative ABC transport system substrate-binding protein
MTTARGVVAGQGTIWPTLGIGLALVLLAGGLTVLAAPPCVNAQAAGAVQRLGFLSSGPAAAPPVEAFRQGLRELGWIEGQNIAIEYRFTEGQVERLADLAAELVRLKVDVIAAGPTPPALAAKRVTDTIPIVMMGAAEPVKLGLIASLARPGGNVTGLSWSASTEIIGKGLELLREIRPKLSRVAILWNPLNPAHSLTVPDVTQAARSLGVTLQHLNVRGADGLDSAFRTMAKQRAEAVVVVADALFVSQSARLAELEAKYRLPAVHSLRTHVDAGSLMAYGPNTAAVWRRAASFVDRILKGARPADLPVEEPTKYDLVINLKTARALGLKLPPSLLQRADHIIDARGVAH